MALHLLVAFPLCFTPAFRAHLLPTLSKTNTLFLSEGKYSLLAIYQHELLSCQDRCIVVLPTIQESSTKKRKVLKLVFFFYHTPISFHARFYTTLQRESCSGLETLEMLRVMAVLHHKRVSIDDILKVETVTCIVLFIYFFMRYEACGILVPEWSSAVKAQSPNGRITQESTYFSLNFHSLFVYLACNVGLG